MSLFDRFRRKNQEEEVEADAPSGTWKRGSTSLRVLYVDDDTTDHLIITNMLDDVAPGAFSTTCVRSFNEAADRIRNERFDVYLVDYLLGERTGLDLLRDELDNGLKGPTILLTGQGDRDTDIEAMRRGASGYLVKGEFEGPGLERAVRYAIETYRAKAAALGITTADDGQGMVVGLIGSRGGVGTSVTATNLAVASAKAMRRTILIDLRLQYGSVEQQLGLHAQHTLGGLSKETPDQIKPKLLQSYLTQHQLPELKLLAAANNAEELPPLSGEKVHAIIAAAAEMSDFVVVDLPNETTEAVKEAILCCDRICAVTDREPTSVTASELLFRRLGALAALDRAGVMVMDRTNLPANMTPANVAAFLDTNLLSYVAASREVLAEALETATPIVELQPTHFIALAMTKLADDLYNKSRTATAVHGSGKTIFNK